jgi:hypothetical protein
MKTNQRSFLVKLIKWFLHIPSLIIALVLVIHVLSSLTDDPFFTWFFRFVGVVVILSAQFFRGMAWLHKQIKLPNWQWKVFGYWFILAIYIICFEFLASVGALVSQVETIELKQETAAFIETENREEYERVKANIETYKRYRDEENKTGKGNKFEHWDNKVTEEEAKLEKLKLKIAAVPETQETTKKSPFLSLSKVYKASADTFKGLMIAAALLMSYITLLVTPWHLPVEILGIKGETLTDNAQLKTLQENETGKTGQETDKTENNIIRFQPLNGKEKAVSGADEARYCQYSKCGKRLPSTMRADAKFCDDNCRLAAYREEKKQGNN